jgi:di/tricarboxylate transporter
MKFLLVHGCCIVVFLVIMHTQIHFFLYPPPPLITTSICMLHCYVHHLHFLGVWCQVDFNSLSWHTLFLLGGGNILGKAIQSSNLLDHLSDLVLKGNNL